MCSSCPAFTCSAMRARQTVAPIVRARKEQATIVRASNVKTWYSHLLMLMQNTSSRPRAGRQVWKPSANTSYMLPRKRCLPRQVVQRRCKRLIVESDGEDEEPVVGKRVSQAVWKGAW
eukprot:3753661-Amphidinium_carterae.1